MRAYRLAGLFFVLPFPLIADAQTGDRGDQRPTVAPPEAPKAVKVTRAFRLKHAEAERAMKIVRDAFGGGSRGFPPANPPVNIAADTKANLLLVNGSESEIEQVAQMLSEIDVPPEEQDRPAMKFFSLKHADAEKAAIIIREATENGDGKFNIALDSRTNSLVARGPRQELDVVEALLARLDEPTTERNVHVEVAVCELRGDPAEVLKDFQSEHNLRIPTTADVHVVFDELLPALSNAGRIAKPIRLAGTTFENKEIRITMGLEKPVIQGTNVGGGNRNHTVAYRSVGTVVSLVPTQSGEGVRIELELEHSRLGPVEDGTAVSVTAGEEVRVPAIATSAFKGSLIVPLEQAVLLGVMCGEDSPVDHGLLVAIRADAE